MQRVIATGAVLVLAAAAAAAQPAEPRRIVGTAMSGRLELNAAATASIETATLEFGDASDAPAFTVEFAAQYAVALPAPPPAIVDMIVTERPNGHSAARVTLQVNDDEPQPLVARRRGARSVVVSMPFDDFVKLASGDRVVEHVFDTDLEFAGAQLRMLRAIAQRWRR